MIWSLPPWRRAPLLLWRRWSVAVVLAAAAALLAAAAAAGPLFVSSAGSATLAQQLAHQCQQGAALRADGLDLFGDSSEDGADPLAAWAFDANGTERAAEVGTPPHVGPPVRKVHAQHVRITAAGSPRGLPFSWVTVISKTGAEQHVDVVSRGPAMAHGVWLADTVATDIGVRPGDVVVLGEGARFLRVPVAGIFADLQRFATPPWWCDDDLLIHSYSNSPTFPFAILDLPTARRVAVALHLDLVDVTSWPVDRAGMTVEDAQRLERTLGSAAARIPVRLAALRDKALGGYVRDHPKEQVSPYLNYRAQPRAATRFHLPAARAVFVADALPSTVLPITAAAVGVALLLVGGAATFWVERRAREIDVLISHGVGPAALGVKGALEAALPLVVGAAAGWAGAGLAVRAVGPSRTVSAQAQATAMWLAAAGAVAAAVVLAAVVAARVGRREQGVGAPHQSRVPWDVIVSTGATVAAIWLAASGSTATTTKGGTLARVDPVVLVVPLLGFVAAAAAIRRLLAALLVRLRPSGDGLGAVRWLAWRRLSGRPATAALLAVAVAVPMAVGVYGATVNGSARRTLADQARLLLGADVVVDLPGRMAVPEAVRDRATVVLRIDHLRLGGVSYSVIGVDPESFANAVSWDSALRGPDPRSLIGRLRDDGAGRPLRGVVSGRAVRAPSLDLGGGSGRQVPVDVVGAAADLPGEQGGYRVLYVDRTALERLATIGSYQLWSRAGLTTVLDSLAARHVDLRSARTADAVIDGSFLQPVAYTFAFLDALVVLVAAVAAGALLLYLDARSRSRRLVYVLARRMGLTRAEHVGSLVVELLAAMLTGLLLGVALAAAAVVVLDGRFDVDPQAPPDTVVSWPLRTVAVGAAVAAVVLLLGVVVAQRSTDRTPPAEVLREG